MKSDSAMMLGWVLIAIAVAVVLGLVVAVLMGGS